jgi:Arc/MetJ-type ribon-helix-helix transcriptional regulator
MPTEQDEQESTGVVKTSVSLPLYLFDWIKEMAHENKFHSQSAVMVTALAEMKGRIEEREAIKKAAKSDPTSSDEPMKLLLMFLTEYPEFVEKINKMKKEQIGSENLKRVEFK